MSWLGVDIGGANLKVADGNGFARSTSFPLWRKPDKLATALMETLAPAPQADALAVTMTGELADCYRTKAAGVASILDAVEQVAAGREVHVYLCDGRLVDAKSARAAVMLAAASNWHVLARYASRFTRDETGLLIDIGSTTSDIIPMNAAGPSTVGNTDPERLASGELVYTGIQRSPICAVVSRLPWHDGTCAVAQEVFATTQDAYLLLEEIAEDLENLDTADGRPGTQRNAHARLARSICADTTMFSRADALRSAAAVREAQLELLSSAAEKVLSRLPTRPNTIVLSGHGEFLGRMLLDRLQLGGQRVSLSAQLGPEISRAACAHALAVLARERTPV